LSDTASHRVEKVTVTAEDQFGVPYYQDTASENYIFEMDFSKSDSFVVTFSKEGYADTSFVITDPQFDQLQDSLFKEGNDPPHKITRDITMRKESQEMIVRRQKVRQAFLDSVVKTQDQNGEATLGEEAYKIMLEEYGDDTLKDLHYKVQVGAYENPGPDLLTELLFSLNVSEVSEIETEETDFGVTRFMVGKDYQKLNDAELIRKKIIKEGVEREDIVIKDSFIALYYQGERIRMFEVLQLFNEQQ
jgi:hypothetical protein